MKNVTPPNYKRDNQLVFNVGAIAAIVSAALPKSKITITAEGANGRIPATYRFRQECHSPEPVRQTVEHSIVSTSILEVPPEEIAQWIIDDTNTATHEPNPATKPKPDEATQPAASFPDFVEQMIAELKSKMTDEQISISDFIAERTRPCSGKLCHLFEINAAADQWEEQQHKPLNRNKLFAVLEVLSGRNKNGNFKNLELIPSPEPKPEPKPQSTDWRKHDPRVPANKAARQNRKQIPTLDAGHFINMCGNFYPGAKIAYSELATILDDWNHGTASNVTMKEVSDCLCDDFLNVKMIRTDKTYFTNFTACFQLGDDRTPQAEPKPAKELTAHDFVSDCCIFSDSETISFFQLQTILNKWNATREARVSFPDVRKHLRDDFENVNLNTKHGLHFTGVTARFEADHESGVVPFKANLFAHPVPPEILDYLRGKADHLSIDDFDRPE